jgi:eukaryotic-like serine/threonine-protein kinase
MDSDAWGRLSEWHNVWLSAVPGDRERLRHDFLSEHPALQADVDELVSAGPIAIGFLETPAFALVLDDLAAEDAALAPGTLVGPYRIVALLARGGMGQVYRATDVRLGRDVAVKLVSSGTQHEPGVVERFIQEARVTAALDRPNIVRLFDVGVHDGRPFLVMELLDGETLRHRLSRGALGAEEARRIMLDVARGLVAAHAADLIHHDLKPENLFLTRAGPAKILDFGVARLAPHAPPQGPPLATMAGMLVGTAGYLAPEEILGDRSDARADLFALGAVAYEMLTGRRAFAREHTIDTLYAVLHDPVPALDIDASGISPQFAAIVTRLLEKAPEARFQSSADLAWTLEQLPAAARAPEPRRHVSPMAPSVLPVQRRTRRWVGGAIAAVGLAAAGLVGVVWGRTSATPATDPPALSQFTWRLPGELRLLSNPIVSPTGRRFAFVGQLASAQRLYIRELSSLEPKAIAGTEGARQPFWSPDGTRLGFFANGKLMTVSVPDGVPVALADAPDPRGGAWSHLGTIVFQPDLRDADLLQVSADGGPVAPAAVLAIEAGDTTYRWPVFLPDGAHFVYHVASIDIARRGIYVGSTTAPARPGARLFFSASGAVFVPWPSKDDATLLTVGDDGIEARAFDTRRLTAGADVKRLPLTAARATPHEPAMLGAGSDILALAQTPVPWGKHLVAMSAGDDRADVLTGQELGSWPRLSPDGRRLVRSWVDVDRGNSDLWVRDLDRGTELRVTSSRDLDVSPTWSPGGDRIAYRAGSLTKPFLAIAQADGTGTSITWPCPGTLCEPTDWSADGRLLLVTVDDDIWTVPVDRSQPPRRLLAGAFVERDARFSPDGRWVAYVSEESGGPEVSIVSLDGPARRVVVSSAEGNQPVWKRDGSAIYYVNRSGQLHHVAVHRTEDRLTLGRAEPVLVPSLGGRHWGTGYDVSPDGSRIFLPRPPSAPPPNEVTLILGWRALLRP